MRAFDFWYYNTSEEPSNWATLLSSESYEVGNVAPKQDPVSTLADQ